MGCLAILAALLAWAPTAAAAPPPARAGAPVSAHAMVHTCCTPPAMKERIFAEAKAMGARFIRVDVELAGIFEAGATRRTTRTGRASTRCSSCRGATSCRCSGSC